MMIDDDNDDDDDDDDCLCPCSSRPQVPPYIRQTARLPLYLTRPTNPSAQRPRGFRYSEGTSRKLHQGKDAWMKQISIDGFIVENNCNSIANALELQLSQT